MLKRKWKYDCFSKRQDWKSVDVYFTIFYVLILIKSSQKIKGEKYVQTFEKVYI